jgi:hypothetical protein
MRNTAIKVLSGLIFAGCALPAMADPSAPMTLKHAEMVSGTFQGYHMGQILLRTENNLDMELPAMAIFFGTDPWVKQANLKVGQPLRVTFPAKTEFVSYGIVDGKNILGSYNGVARIPDSIVSTWSKWEAPAKRR